MGPNGLLRNVQRFRPGCNGHSASREVDGLYHLPDCREQDLAARRLSDHIHIRAPGLQDLGEFADRLSRLGDHLEADELVDEVRIRVVADDRLVRRFKQGSAQSFC